MLGLKFFVRVQTFQRRPFLPSQHYCHPELSMLQVSRFNDLIYLTFQRGRSSSVKIAVSSGVGGVVTSGNVTSRWLRATLINLNLHCQLVSCTNIYNITNMFSVLVCKYPPTTSIVYCSSMCMFVYFSGSMVPTNNLKCHHHLGCMLD